MSRDVSLALAKLSLPVAWLIARFNGVWGWFAGLDWTAITGMLTSLYTLAMLLHLLLHWHRKAPPHKTPESSDDDPS